MNNIILAIDLGKYKSVVCVLDETSGEYRFTTFDTSHAQLQKLIAKEQPAVVVIEACLLAGWVHDLCGELGVRCLVANTASEAWKFKHLKRKTDKDDALRVAQLHLLGQSSPSNACLPGTGSRNAHLRWALGEAACLYLRSSDRAKLWQTRMHKKHAPGKTLGILAAKLGRTVYHLLRTKTVFDERRFFAS